MITPNRPPLWEAMHEAFWRCPKENWRLSSAYMIRAVAEWLYKQGSLDDLVARADTIKLLYDEADRAERGE